MKNIIVAENITDPTAPEIVLFGLNFVNFGPLKNLPNTYPPISDPIHVIKIKKNNIFKCKKEEKIINTEQKAKI